MCRLFGFRSVIQSQVHRSLVEADNALWNLSERHPDGWGVAYYVDGTPHLTRSAQTALRDRVFQRVSGVVASETVVAHVRKATQGTISVLNCHPFQHGRWVFAHNGDIPNFSEHRNSLVHQVEPRLRRYILGDTDSEVLFFLVLSELLRIRPLVQAFGAEETAAAVCTVIARVRAVCDVAGEGAPATRSLLTCLLTDGSVMVGVHGGKELYASTHKRRCPERDTCSSFRASCEAPSARDGVVNHLVFASEPLGGHNVFEALNEGDVIAIDGSMRLFDRRVAAAESA